MTTYHGWPTTCADMTDDEALAADMYDTVFSLISATDTDLDTNDVRAKLRDAVFGFDELHKQNLSQDNETAMLRQARELVYARGHMIEAHRAALIEVAAQCLAAQGVS